MFTNNSVVYNATDFKRENLIFRWNNILSDSSYDTNDYKLGQMMCMAKFWENAYFNWLDCGCREWYAFSKDGKRCISLNEYIENIQTSK